VRSARGEGGYATLAALAAAAIFGTLALEAVSSGRSAAASAHAEQSRARLVAATDAGVALAIERLNLPDRSQRWPLTGPPHALTFDGVDLVVAVEDENGKVPLNFLIPPRVRRLFELGGADPRDIDDLTQAVLAMRTQGPTASAAAGAVRRLGPLATVDELALLPHMTPALFAAIAPAVTVTAATPAFDARTASPLASAVMSDAGQPAASPGGDIDLAGHAVTVRVEARDRLGGALRRATVVEFTGAANRPFVVRAVD